MHERKGTYRTPARSYSTSQVALVADTDACVVTCCAKPRRTVTPPELLLRACWARMAVAGAPQLTIMVAPRVHVCLPCASSRTETAGAGLRLSSACQSLARGRSSGFGARQLRPVGFMRCTRRHNTHRGLGTRCAGRFDSCCVSSLSTDDFEPLDGATDAARLVNDSSRLSDAISDAAAARIDLAQGLQREKELQSEITSLRQSAERAVVAASTLLEAREAAARKLQAVEADSELRRSAAAAAVRIRALEDELATTTLRAERELREALARAQADAATTLANAVAEARATAAAAEARAAALENQLAGTEDLASRLTATLRAKASADNDVATLMTSNAALLNEVATLREARAAAEVRAADGEARGAAAERSVAERVRETLQAAESCVAAAEAIKVETEQRAAAAAERAEQELQAARTRADVAEAELARRVLLLANYAEANAAAASQRVELSAAAQRIAALEAECAALREARAASDEAATAAQARADAADAAVAADVERLVAANDEKWRAADSMVAARALQLPLELTLARADAVGAAATATAATEALKAFEASAERQLASLQRALMSAERSLADWKARALALEAAASGDADAARVTGRLRASSLQGAELRRLLAHGPRRESGGKGRLDLYAEIEQAATPEPVE